MEKQVFETFRELNNYSISQLKSDTPTCFNGDIRIEKYRITIEKVEEPKEVLEQRLQKLWDECNNFHHWTPLKEKAKQIGYELKGSAGLNYKKK